MLCPHCGADNPTAFGYCQGCAKPLSTVESAPPPPFPAQASGLPAAAAPAMSPAMAAPKPMSLVAMLAMAAVVLLIVTLGLMLSASGDTESERAGYRIGRTFAALALPFLIAYAIAGRKKARKPNQFALFFCVFGVIFIGGSVSREGNLDTSFETPDQRVGRLMREAAGVQPVHRALFPSRRREDDALRDQFRILVQTNRDYSATVNKMDISRVKNINAPESFVAPDFDGGGLKQLHALYDADAAQEVKAKEIVTNLRLAVASTASSESERQAVVKGFDNGVAASMSKRQTVVAAEKAWIDALDEEYSYAAQHSSHFQLNQGRLAIDDSDVREEFNTRVRSQEARRKEFLAAQKDFTDFQAQSLQKMGVNPKDIGAK